MLCTINYVRNGEKLELKDIRIYEAEQKDLETTQERAQAVRRDAPPGIPGKIRMTPSFAPWDF